MKLQLTLFKVIYKVPLLILCLAQLGWASNFLRSFAVENFSAMKINAIGGRGYRRDFVDLYFLAQIRPLPVIWEDFKKRYAGTGLSTFHVKKSLTYFVDAEKDPMPKMIKRVDWKKVREFFEKETKNLEL